jgi:hypothetical protein
MKSDDGNTPEAAPHPPAANNIEDEVTEAVEHSYASRFTAGTDLSPDELKRIKEKLAATTTSSERGSG